jgi:hypothetical protein
VVNEDGVLATVYIQEVSVLRTDTELSLPGILVDERFDAAGGQLVDNSGVTIKFNTSSFEDIYYSSTGSTIMVNKDGRYMITFRVTLEMTGGNNRSASEYYLLNNGT